MSWYNTITQQRPGTGNIEIRITKYETLGLTTSRKKIDEIWEVLRYHALISPAIENSLQSQGVRSPQREYLKTELIAYFDQAESFFKSALLSDYRSAPLLYYYSFLNLAKAAIIVHRPHFSRSKFHHGIKRQKISGPLINRTAKIKPHQGRTLSVFDELYQIEYGTSVAGKNISLGHLFEYVSDVTVETRALAGSNVGKVHDVLAYIFCDENAKTSWTVLATKNGFYPKKYPKTFDGFAEEFERFNIDPTTAQLGLGMRSGIWNAYNFSQSKKTFPLLPSGSLPVSDNMQLVRQCFRNFYQDNIYDRNVSFTITDPLKMNDQIPFNEPLSIYYIMYYLSEIVRYNPSEFYRVLADNSTEGWLIKSFVEASPYRCLNYLAGLITGKLILLDER